MRIALRLAIRRRQRTVATGELDESWPTADLPEPERDPELADCHPLAGAAPTARGVPALLRGPLLRLDRRALRHARGHGRRNARAGPRCAAHVTRMQGGGTMSQLSDELGSRLALVVPELDEPDWDDVLARADLFGHAVPRPRRWSRLRMAPRALIFAIVVVLMGGSLALAVGGRVVHALGDGPAPTPDQGRVHRDVAPAVPARRRSAAAEGLPAGQDHQGQRAPRARPSAPGRTRRRRCTRRARSSGTALLRERRAARTVRTAAWPVARRAPFSLLGEPARAVRGRASLPRREGARASRPSGRRSAGVRCGATRLRIVYADGTHHDLPLVDGLVHVRDPDGPHASRDGPDRASTCSRRRARASARARIRSR